MILYLYKINMATSVQNILNQKLSSIIYQISLDNNIDYDELFNFVKKKKYFRIEESYYNKYLNNDLDEPEKFIHDKLIDYLKNDPKILVYNKNLEDVQNILIKICKKENINYSFITIDFINDIIISYINSFI